VRKITYISICALLCLILGNRAFASNKVDPFFTSFFDLSETKVSLGKAASVSVGGEAEPLADAFIKVNDLDAAVDAVERVGGQVRAVISDELFTAEIPLSGLDELEADESIIFIEAAKPVEARNDVAMTELNGYEVHNGLDLPDGYTGSGVIVGIVDTGIDLTHNDFLDEDGNSRVLFVWDQKQSSGSGPSEINSSYGTECDKAMIENGSCPVTDQSGHGTHITGTAAGRDETYGGVAPDANIISVRYNSELSINGYADPIFSTTICEAVFYVFKKAQLMEMPAVVNLSLGTHIGAHDGTSLFEQCLDELIEGSSGRAIVAAAGNEHNPTSTFAGIHAGYEVDGKTASNFRIRSVSQGRLFYLDLWQSVGSSISVGIIVRNAISGAEIGSTPMIAPGDSESGVFDDGLITWQIDATETANALNGKPHAGITLLLDDSISNPGIYDFDLVVDGSGSFDAWWFPDKSANSVEFTTKTGENPNGTQYTPGDDRMVVAIPSTASNVIAVGAYTSRTQWEIDGSSYRIAFELGDILPFSSIGPSADPEYTGQKPEITAPGAMIASARSRHSNASPMQDLSDGEHTLEAGTSMATPFVTGTIALMFSASSSYTFEDAERYIIKSAYADEFTGEVPNDIWGYGKLDILAAMQTAINGGPSGSGTNESLSAPAGKSGCTMIPGQAFSHHMIPAVLSVLSMLVVVVTTRRRKTKSCQRSAVGYQRKPDPS
jgi:minor extracellular serine protease Vpr